MLLSKAVVEGALEADEFTNERVVAAISLVAFGGEEVIEIQFRLGIVLGQGLHQASHGKPWACHANEA